MKASALTLALSLTATMVQPGSASIGRAADLACKLFCDGIAQLFVEIFGKRDLPPGYIQRRTPQGDAPPGVPQFEYERCYEDIAGLSVTATSPGPGSVRFDGVPPACMNLASVLVGDPVNGPYPTPCGSDCLVYNDLSDAQFNQLVDALNAVAA